MSPPTSPPGTPFRLSDLELASRLSFFLWSSIPDDELRRRGGAGQLKNPAVLERQVRRLLADPRADALVSNFAGQWLFLRELKNVRPDSPDFDENLRRSFQQETELLFRTIVREDAPIIDLLDADFTFVDERLARHYGMADIRGSRVRRVPLAAERSAPRAARSGQRADRHISRQPHIARRPRQVGARQPARHAAAAAAAGRRDEPREGCRQVKVTSLRQRLEAASRECGLRVMPQGDGSDRPDARELRSRRQVAHRGRKDPDRRDSAARRWDEARWAVVAAPRAARAVGRVCHCGDGEAADVCVGSRGAVSGHARSAGDHPRCRARQISFLIARPRHREEHTVSDATPRPVESHTP